MKNLPPEPQDFKESLILSRLKMHSEKCSKTKGNSAGSEAPLRVTDTGQQCKADSDLQTASPKHQ